jgi:transposase
LGEDRNGKLALWQVIARLLGQGSRLSATRLAASHGACDVLGLEAFNEDNLYRNLAWLSDNQEAIEKRLFRMRYGKAAPQLFLYDVTSSYLEGTKNSFGAFGYNRDGKKGKLQVVIGLLTDEEGHPVSVRVFSGNTPDTKTVGEQIDTLAKSFGIKDVVFVGDRGMLKTPQIELLNGKGFQYITAITKPQILKLMDDGLFQMSLFDKDFGEVEADGGIRYILRRNPFRAEEVLKNCTKKMSSLEALVREQNDYLASHAKAKVETALKKAMLYMERVNVNRWITIELAGRELVLRIDNEAFEQERLLDGCYVIKTDVPVAKADAKTIHARYRDLANVEKAFRTFKNGHLEIRPTFVVTKASTLGHVFVVMLAYILERELERCWRHLDLTVSEGLDSLGSIRGVIIRVGESSCQQIPAPVDFNRELLEAAGIVLPEVIPYKEVCVATRHKLPLRRKNK